MVEILVVPWDDPRGIAMRDAMNAETGAMYATFTSGLSPEQVVAVDDALSIDPAEMVVSIIALDGDTVVGHSALRPFEDAFEVKKVYTIPQARGLGAAKAMLAWLEDYARERGVASLVLQTGPLQVAAIRLYEQIGYTPIPAYGKYGVIPGALCFVKAL